MKRFSLIAVLLGFAVVSFSLARSGLSDQQGEKKSDARTKLEQLQKERIEALKILVERIKAQYEHGAGSDLSALNAVQQELIDAKLDATDKPGERIALLEKQVKFAREVFEHIERQREAGFRATEADYLRAKANYLNVEIKLAKEEAKQDESKAAEKP